MNINSNTYDFGGKTMKKIITFLLIVVTICLCFVGCGEPKSSPVEDFEYEFEDGTVTITGYIGSDLEIIIPNTIEKRPVTTIGKDAFKGYDMTSITIPEGVTIISTGAFVNCSNLEVIELPNTIKEFNSSLDDTKWYDNQPDGVLYLDEFVVGHKGSNPDIVTIKDGTKAILRGTFGGTAYANSLYSEFNGSISAIHIPESVNYIAEESVGYIHYEDLGCDVPSDSIIIYGKSGSVAETYANDNKIQFMEE
jgi:hypothetical protein